MPPAAARLVVASAAPSMISATDKPCLPSSTSASAASPAENAVSAPSCSAFSRITSICPAYSGPSDLKSLIFFSKSADALTAIPKAKTAAAPNPTRAVPTAAELLDADLAPSSIPRNASSACFDPLIAPGSTEIEIRHGYLLIGVVLRNFGAIPMI